LRPDLPVSGLARGASSIEPQRGQASGEKLAAGAIDWVAGVLTPLSLIARPPSVLSVGWRSVAIS
jgi:hypothetical protein